MAPQKSESEARLAEGERPSDAGDTASVETQVPAAPGPARRERGRRALIEWALVLILAVGGALLIRTFVVQTFSVPSSSMFPTLQIGDRIIVEKIPGLSHAIGRGDVIVFHKVPADQDGEGPEDLVKRVIGLPGDRLRSVGDTIYVNGKPLREPYLDLSAVSSQGKCAEAAYDIPKKYSERPIPAGHYFVMGDCRGISDDSRFWGTVPISYVIGKVVTVVWRHGHPWIHWI